MAVHIVAMTSIRADGGSAFDKYMSVVGPLMRSASAKEVSRFELCDNIVGKNQIQYVSVIEYPDESCVKMVFDSADYKSLEEVKRQAFSNYQVNVALTM